MTKKKPQSRRTVVTPTSKTKKALPNLKNLHTQFLEALAQMERRTGDGKRLIEVDQKHLKKCLREAQRPLVKILELRRKAAYRTRYGYNRIKPEIIRANVIEKCREDIVYFANNWCWIFNPWLTRFDHMVEGGFSARLPFILFQKAEDYMLWREKLYNQNRIGLIYKARELGVSWDNCLWHVHHFFFEDGFQGRFGSRKEGLVDSRGNPDTLFWKIRFIIYNTPSWFRHPDMKTRQNNWDNLLKIENPANGAVLAGEGGDNIGTGGRASAYDLDEWAKVAHDKMCESGLSANCRCRFYTATPNGMDNDYAEKFHSGKVLIFDFPWHADPRKNDDWLKNFEEDHAEPIVAQEVHRKFDAFNVGQAIPPEWALAAIELYNRIESGAVPYEWGQTRHGGLDVAAGGRNRSVLLWREGIVIRDVYEWDIDNTTTLVEKAGTVAEEYNLGTLNYDPIAVGVGVRSTFDLSNYKFQAIPVDSRSAASEIPLPGDTRPARERCRNRRAELVCRVRKRFERTYEFIEKRIEHPF